MIRLKHVLAVLFCAPLLLTACGGGGPGQGGNSGASEGDPVPGGSVQVVQGGEPRSLDPAAMINVWVSQGLVGNALYGTLMVNSGTAFDLEYKMATDFSTTDGGATFTLALRPELAFTDGTPLDATAVKYNWDRLRDPALGSPSLPQASQVAATEVIDPLTLKVQMVKPNPYFAQSLVVSGMNWIASPSALEQGAEAFNENPVGAGPFTFVSWQRQASIDLVKNPGYWDAPRPYVDKLVIRTVGDTNQRVNSIITGAADLAMEASWASIAQIEAAGFEADTMSTGGGQFMGMNNRKAPFDDERARRAVALAIDVEALNTAVYNGNGEIPRTLFQEDSPFYTDSSLPTHDPQEAQKLFDELAADGKPLSFTFLAYTSRENRATAEAVQAQLSAYNNVDIDVDVVDFAAGVPRIAAREFDMVILSATIQDPDASLWNVFHSTSRGNYTGVSDKQLDDALDAGRVAPTMQERIDAYQIVQDRLVVLNPGVWYTRSAPTAVSGENIRGISMYGQGSTLPEQLWLAQ